MRDDREMIRAAVDRFYGRAADFVADFVDRIHEDRPAESMPEQFHTWESFSCHVFAEFG